nr:EOG090X072S [Eurycercus lamellatus]
MAFYDNKYWILSHVRNSFLYSDDTGMCEMVMQNTDVPKKIREEGRRLWYGQLDDSEEEYDDDGRIHTRSLGNCNDDFGARRRRLNTVVRLEKMRKEQQAAAMISTIRWKEPDPTAVLDPEEKKKIFTKKEVFRAQRPYSALSKLMADHASDPDSPFLEYAKFDGQSQLRAPTRTIRIFLSMQGSEEERNYPMTVCVIASAKVVELIGLVCYKYNHEKRDPPLSGPVDNYALFIAEDDGSPDADFPCLEPKEIVGKFGFTSLALVRAASPVKEAKNEPELTEIDEIEQKNNAEKATEDQAIVLESTDFHSFKGISWDQVEIKPCPSSRSVLPWSRPNLKPTQLPMEVIVDCVAMQNAQAAVGIIYYHTDKRKWRRLRIECDTRTIDQVTAKLRFILEIRGGHYRQEYLHHTSSMNKKRASLSN